MMDGYRKENQNRKKKLPDQNLRSTQSSLVLYYPKIYARINRQKPAIRYGNKIEARVFATVRSFVILRWCLLYARSWVGAAPAIYLSLNSICKYHYIRNSSLIGSTMAVAGPLLRVYCTRITLYMPHGTVI